MGYLRKTWRSMLHRCYNKNNKNYHNYGGRGIKVCDRWRCVMEGFANFALDMGDRPSPKHSLDRYPNNDGDYEPGNCRWATAKEQGSNKRGNHRITAFGETKTVEEFARQYGTNSGTVVTRLKMGWTPEDALTKPAAKKFSGVRMVTAFGRTQSVSAWCEELGQSRSVITKRLNAGWEPEEALATKNPASASEVVVVAGITATIAEHCRRVGIDRKAVAKRLKRGWSVEQALMTPVSGFHPKANPLECRDDHD